MSMRSLYLDIFSGISGDMFIGAMIDLGVDFRELDRELGKLGLGGYHLHVARKHKSSIEGVKFDVHLEGEPCDHGHGHDHGHERTFATIRRLIEDSTLSDWVKTKSIAVFHRVAVAEGKVHGLPAESVHFHEVGAIDSIVDIVGAAVCLELLGKPRVSSANVVEGTGFVNCAHGRFPIPTTATLEILGTRGIGVTQCDEPHELVTPTGAAILAEFVDTFGPMGSVVAQRIGYGLGTRNNKTRPNVLRAVLSEGTSTTPEPDWLKDRVSVLETNLDDVSGEILGYVLEKALRLGALDAFHTPIQMKKQRPGVLLTLLCEPHEADRFTEFLLLETSAFGVRRTEADRRKLHRDHIPVKTPFGTVQVKRGLLDGKVVQQAPEYESCKGVAAMAGVSVKSVFEAVRRLLP